MTIDNNYQFNNSKIKYKKAISHKGIYLCQDKWDALQIASQAKQKEFNIPLQDSKGNYYIFSKKTAELYEQLRDEAMVKSNFSLFIENRNSNSVAVSVVEQLLGRFKDHINDVSVYLNKLLVINKEDQTFADNIKYIISSRKRASNINLSETLNETLNET